MLRVPDSVLDSWVTLLRNPWSHTVPNEDLAEILFKVARSRAAHVKKHAEDGNWRRDSLGLAIVDPTFHAQTPEDERILATIAIGDFGGDYLENAIAKALYHARHGVPAGYGVYVDLTKSEDGDFCYGYSTCVDGTIVGASAQTELQDGCEAGHAAVTFNYFVRVARHAWRERHPDHRWFCKLNEPNELYVKVAMSTGIA